MTENDVKLIVKTQQELYEKHVGMPRHAENLKNFTRLFAFANKLRGAIAAITLVIGLPALMASCIVILKYLQGKP